MSISATTNLGLLYAGGDDPVPNYPSINEHNMDLLDDLFSNFDIQSYIPSLEFSDSPPNIGTTGEIRGRFYKTLDIVHFWIWIQLSGNGVDMGSGSIRATLPFRAHSSYALSDTGSAIGGGYTNPGGGLDRCSIVTKLSASGDRNVVFFTTQKPVPSWVIQGDEPAVYAAGDQIESFGRYKIA